MCADLNNPEGFQKWGVSKRGTSQQQSCKLQDPQQGSLDVRGGVGGLSKQNCISKGPVGVTPPPHLLSETCHMTILCHIIILCQFKTRDSVTRATNISPDWKKGTVEIGKNGDQS